MGAKALGFHSVAPRCVRTTRWGRCVNDSGRPGIVQRKGMVGIVRHSQTKGRATGNAKPGLKPPDGRPDISVSEIPADAVPGVGSGRGTLERGQSKRSRIGILEWRRRTDPKAVRRGKAPCCEAEPNDEERAST